MKKTSIAAVKRLFASNIGRTIGATFPRLTVRGNTGNTIFPAKCEYRKITGVTSNALKLEKLDGSPTSFTFGGGVFAFIGKGIIELHDPHGLCCTYFFIP